MFIETKKEKMRDDQPAFLCTVASLFQDYILTAIEETAQHKTKQEEARQFAMHHKGTSIEGCWKDGMGHGQLTLVHRLKRGREGLRVVVQLKEDEKGIDASLVKETIGFQEAVIIEASLLHLLRAAKENKASLFIDNKNFQARATKQNVPCDPVIFTSSAVPVSVNRMSMGFFSERILPVLHGPFSNKTTVFSMAHKRVMLNGEWQDAAQSGHMEIMRKGNLVEPMQKMRVDFSKEAETLVVNEVYLSDMKNGTAMLRDAIHSLDERAKANQLGICFTSRSVTAQP